ncbi:MAG TPA: rod shape-determining protein MreD [Burkholderiaceae bacterium]
MRLWRFRRANGEFTSSTTLPRGQPHKQVLRPVSPVFIWMTLVAGLSLDLLPWGRTPLVPDFLALTLVFWNVHQPRRLGMGAAFLFGLLIDVHDGALFGEHALAYTLLSYGAIALHRRITWFPVVSQSLYVLPLLLVAQLASAAVRLWVGGASANWWIGLTESAVGTLLWPLVTWILLAPQRRPVSRDETRPL